MKKITYLIAFFSFSILLTSCEKLFEQQPKCETQCLNGGTVTATCGCNCPPGTSGDNCQTVEKNYTWSPPPVTIHATDILQGDCDVYGIGSWESTFRMKIQGNTLILEGDITFSENYGDHSQIVGSYTHTYLLSEIIGEMPNNAYVRLSQSTGSVSGSISTTSVRSFDGNGFIDYAKILTDTNGCDDGEIGGKIYFNDIILTVR